jgi:cation transport regulator ChaC
MMHFAYGSNMSRRLMRRRAPAAQPAGVARLPGYCFVITRDGYASVEQSIGGSVYGLLWHLTARDRVTLDAWENVPAGLYRPAMLPVQAEGRRRPALVYVARPSRPGRAKSGYMEVVIAAAREWEIPESYIQSLQHWLPPRTKGNPSAFKGPSHKTGEFG